MQTKFRLLLSLLLVGICVLASSTFAIHPTAFALTNDAYQIITQDLASGQMNIHLPAGSYVVSQGIKITEPNVQIYGDGENSTILTPNNASINTLISFRYADNFSIHDLQITGIAVGQTSPTSNNGIITSQSNYGLIENIYAHDFKQFTIEYQNANGGLILNNLVVNSGSNGISINDENGGQGTVVKGNVVDGASDVGITAFVGRNFLAANNTVRNVALHSSPFGENVHWGMAVEGDHLVAGATSSNVTYSNNLIVNCGAAGLVATANNNQTSTGVDHNISFYNNTVMNSASGLIVSDVDGFISKGNLFTSFPASAKAGITVYQGLSSNIDIENEFIGPLPLTATAGVIIYGGSGKFVNSTIVTNRSPAIFVSQAVKPNWILSYTVITNSNTTSTTSSTSSTSTIRTTTTTTSSSSSTTFRTSTTSATATTTSTGAKIVNDATAGNSCKSCTSSTLSFTHQGNVLVVVVVGYGLNVPTVVSVGGVSASKLNSTSASTGSSVGEDLWYVFLSSSGTSTVSVQTKAGPNNYLNVIVQSFTGTVTTAPFFENTATNTVVGRSVSVTVNSGTIGRRIIMAVAAPNSSSYTLGSGQKDIWSTQGNSHFADLNYEDNSAQQTMSLSGFSISTNLVTIGTAILPVTARPSISLSSTLAHASTDQITIPTPLRHSKARLRGF